MNVTGIGKLVEGGGTCKTCHFWKHKGEEVKPDSYGLCRNDKISADPFSTPEWGGEHCKFWEEYTCLGMVRVWDKAFAAHDKEKK